jgi:hypothetical protein
LFQRNGVISVRQLRLISGTHLAIIHPAANRVDLEQDEEARRTETGAGSAPDFGAEWLRMKVDTDKMTKPPRATLARASLLLTVGACFTLFAAGCFESHEQETVTVAPRATVSPAPAATDANSRSAAPEVDAETEAAGDALAHAMVALKIKRRDEALYYMNLARTRLTRCLNRSAADAGANSNLTRERLMNDVRELDAAERFARHNDYQQSVAQLHQLSDELDRLNSSLIRPPN